MNALHCITEPLESLLQAGQTFEEFGSFVSQFHQSWMQLGQMLQQALIQQRIEQLEQGQIGCRQKRSRQYHTPLGTICLQRRVYDSAHGSVCLADEQLNLPNTAWLPQVLELASALGVGSEFPNAQGLFERWTHIDITEKTLANQVETAGEQLQQFEFAQAPLATAPLASSLTQAVCPPADKARIYIGVDGVMTPLNAAQGYKEALVGVVFWEADHWQVSAKRAVVRRREYVATLQSRPQFSQRVASLYTRVVKQAPHQVVVLGDGAAWIWQMAETYFPHCIEILDFFHVSEYVWAVARAAFPQHEDQQKQWVEQQQGWLKHSQWQQVVQTTTELVLSLPSVREAGEALVRYLTNNQSRIDYQRYLQMGLMIGSGVVESSNRRVVTQRLKQAGMHWSKRGAEAVMALRASYLSDSQRWQQFWYPSAA